MRKQRRVLFCGQGGGGEDDVAELVSSEKEMERYSRDDGSHFSLTGEILPSLGATARSNRRVHLRRFIISPFDPRYRYIYLLFLQSIYIFFPEYINVFVNLFRTIVLPTYYGYFDCFHFKHD